MKDLEMLEKYFGVFETINDSTVWYGSNL